MSLVFVNLCEYCVPRNITSSLFCDVNFRFFDFPTKNILSYQNVVALLALRLVQEGPEKGSVQRLNVLQFVFFRLREFRLHNKCVSFELYF